MAAGTGLEPWLVRHAETEWFRDRRHTSFKGLGPGYERMTPAMLRRDT